MLEEHQEIILFGNNIPLHIFISRLGFVAKHWHSSMELLMILEGEITVSVDDEKYVLKKEDIILINQNSVHELISENAVMITLQIDLPKYKLFNETIDHMVFNCNSTTDHNSEIFDGIRFAIARIVLGNTRNSSASEYKNYSLSYYLLGELIEHFQVPPTKEQLKQQKYLVRLTRIIDYINKHYAENFTLSDLADSENLSVPYLSNFFKKYMGMNFSQYYTNVRLDHAVKELLESPDSIEQIALRNGFSEQHAFANAFKKRYQMLPSAYRKEKKVHFNDLLPHNNVNYLRLEPNNYLHLLTRYTQSNIVSDFPDKVVSSKKLSISGLSVTNCIRTLKHTFKTFTAVGRAKDLLNADIQSMLTDLQKNIGYEYIKFHGILSDDMMVVTRSNGKLDFNYTLVDMALDFLISIRLKPLIQFSFMPAALAKNPKNTFFANPFINSMPADIREWDMLIDDFTRHLIKRYGIPQVSDWLFCVWNEPMTPTVMFGFENPGDYFLLYEHTFKTVKKICPNLIFGSPSIIYMENLGNQRWIEAYISYTKKHNCIPEFINVHYYADILTPQLAMSCESKDATTSRFPTRTDDFSLWIGSIRKIFSNLGLKKLPIYLTEWNFTLSHRNLINDTCYKSCYIMMNLLKNYDRLDSFGYWTLTDLIEENALPHELFHGGLGMYTMNGIRKNVFWCFYFTNKLGSELIAFGDGYFITKNKDAIQIITYNYIHYGNIFASGEVFDMTQTTRYSAFDMTKSLELSLELTDLKNGQHALREYYVNRSHGSAYDIWLSMGSVPLDAEDVSMLADLSSPGFHKEYIFVEKKRFIYKPILEPLEIRFAELRKVP